MMNYNGFNIEKFEKIDIYQSVKYGYSRNLTLEEIIPIAIENRYPIIVRDGCNAKWYLKVKNKTEDVIREKISKSHPKFRLRVLYFIPRLCQQDEDVIIQEHLEQRISIMRRAVHIKKLRKMWMTKIDEKKKEIALKQMELFEIEEAAFIDEEIMSKMTDEEFSREYFVI